MAKFKVGDLIRLADTEDIMYRRNGYWRVAKIQKNGYVLWSYTNKDYITQKRCKHFLQQKKYKNMMEFIDCSYRLLTDAEKVLYVKA